MGSLTRADTLDGVRAAFRWRVPDRLNMGVACLAADAAAPALLDARGAGDPEVWSFGRLRAAADRLANGLTGLGLGRGDRLGILLPQAPETAIAHLAAYRAGLIALPLFTLFGPEALEHRLVDSEATALVTGPEHAEIVRALLPRLPALRHLIVVGAGASGPGLHDWADLLAAASDVFAPVDTAADDPALIIYTSGTTGKPKGALHAHRVLIGHLPGVEWPHDFFPQVGDRFWTPADWAWIGGLLDVLLPSLMHGVPVVAARMAKFEPDRAADLIRRLGVRNLFLPPTALKLMRAAGPLGPLPVRSVASGGETLGAELLEWGQAAFGCPINEFYGQTECNVVVGNNGRVAPIRPGWMGPAVPGHEVAVIGPDGAPLPPDAEGDVAIAAPDPVMFLGYWRNPEATAAKFRGRWLVTGDRGAMDAAGWLRFVGRDDDVISSAGYRIGPGPIEDCLVRHPAVAMAAAVGAPDPIRGEIVRAHVVLKPGHVPSDALAEELSAFVAARLAAHERPRAVRFEDALPMTATGKILRRELRARD